MNVRAGFYFIGKKTVVHSKETKNREKNWKMFYSMLMLFIIIIWARSNEYYVVEWRKKCISDFVCPFFIYLSISQDLNSDFSHFIIKTIIICGMRGFDIFSYEFAFFLIAKDTQTLIASHVKWVALLNMCTLLICLVYEKADRDLFKLQRNILFFSGHINNVCVIVRLFNAFVRHIACLKNICICALFFSFKFTYRIGLHFRIKYVNISPLFFGEL